ncbi:MAG: cadherin domain-containing protein [Phycisphaerales bacterium]|nr:cadherin domain-containing protein [Phycisphaerales bacterium]MCB9855475.1 cadherin domain-containing protein [Phycisphaerales bacterium]MCB9864252.1 cadherin domain-containing protein [Phycisphaerales bacterium]
MLRLRTKSHEIRLAAIIAITLATTVPAQAATIFWIGGNGDNWGTAANWSPPQVPGSGDAVYFKPDAASFGVNLGGARSVASIEIQSGTLGAYTFSGGALTLESGQFIDRDGSHTHTVNCDVILNAPGYFLVSSGGTLVMNNPMMQSVGATGFTKGFAGTLILNAANSIDGTIDLQSGTIALGDDEALRDNAVQLGATGSLDVSGSDAIVGALQGSGTVNMGGAARFRVGDNNSDASFSGSILGNGQFTKVGTGNLRIESALSGFNGFLIAGDGTLTVNGTTTRRTHVESGAILAGNGSVGLLAVSQNGTVSPGDNGIGTLTTNGICQILGDIYLEIGGTAPGSQHDQIVVTSQFQGRGPLHLSYVNGFVASPTDEFILVTADSLQLSGQWGNITWPDDQAWLLDYDNANGTITARICPVTTADCNGNGIGDECEPDRDGDGIIDDCDICNNGPNDQDADGDGVPDGCDVCPGVDDNGPDADGDGRPDECDLCYGNDNSGDADNDGICNNRDECPGFDDSIDSDGDDVPDGCDACPGFDDNGPDTDGDGVVDGCDQCHGDDTVGDSDGDGVCDDADVCSGFDDTQDADADGIPDNCDQCEGDDATGDTDGDGRCDDRDMCPGVDDFGPDADGDGLTDACDFCQVSHTGDLDGDTDVDASDFEGFDVCLTGPGIDAGVLCDCYDMDPDGEITIRDYGMFQRAFTGPAYIEEAPGEINIQNIANGVSTKGVAFYGGNDTDLVGYSVALVGDINGDGYGEMIVGAPSYGTDVIEHAGRVYVVYGGPDVKNIILENIANGVGGFVMDGTGGFDHPYPTREIGESLAYPDYFDGFGGPQGEGAGFDVAPAGDVNGDGIPDIIVSAPYGVANGAIWGGRTYVVFGGGSVGGMSPISLNLLTLGGQGTGFMIEGERGICLTCPDEFVGERNGDLSGWAVDGARDVNGDGLADVLVSATNYGNDDGGRAYAVFGKANGESVSLSSVGAADGPGLRFDMADYASNQRMGFRLFGVSDYSGDGLTDFMVTSGNLGNLSYIARSIGAAGTIALTEGIPIQDVTILQGAALNCAFGVDEETGEPLANGCTGRFIPGFPNHGGGDFNGDGLADFARMMWNFDRDELEIMVYFNTQGNFLNLAGRFGEPEAPFEIPDRGVRIYSSNISPSSWKNEVTLNSDVNGDGYDDVVIGVGHASRSGARSTYVVFGGPDSRSINLDTLLEDGTGVVITGGVNGTQPGFAVDTSGDVNGDGINDILIGDPKNDRIGQDAGSVYLVYGDDFSGAITHRGDASANTLTGTAADDAVVGGRGGDVLIGNGGFDSMYGGAGDDVMIVGDAGFHRVRGGEGFDTLAVDGGVSLDLESLRGRIDEIEQIDLSAAGADVLRVTRIDVLNLSPTSNQLFVRGTAEDEVVSSSENWLDGGSVDVNGTIFKKFMDGRAELFVQDGIPLRFAPFIVTESIDMPENTPTDASIGFVSAYDPDGGQVVEYAILGGDGQGFFNIDNQTGELFVTADMDFEMLTPPSFSLDVKVTDDQGNTVTSTIVVNVLDLNEAPMWTLQDQIVTSMDEHPRTGLLLGNYAAVDPDDGDELRYYLDITDPTLVEPAVAGAFAMDAATGKLTVSNGSLLDYERQIHHQMMVFAEDLGGLRTPPILVTFTLEDVPAWVDQFDGAFQTSQASMWSAGGIGLSAIQFQKDVNLDDSPRPSVTFMGQDISGQVAGQIHFESTITTDHGYVNARIPLSAEVTFPDEVAPGQPMTISLYLLEPVENRSMSGMTPSADVDMLVEFTNFGLDMSFDDYGPYNFSNSADPYLTSSVGRPWTAVVQPDGSLATNATVTTTLLSMDVDWDQYVENFLTAVGLPSNEAEHLPYEVGPVELDVSYILWAMTMSGAVKVDQDLSLQVDGYSAVIVFENGDSRSMIVGGDTTMTLPVGADVNGDGLVDYELRIDIDTTFTNDSDFYGTISKTLEFGYFDIMGSVSGCPECGTDSITFGPLFSGTFGVDVFHNDALGPFPTSWPEGQAGQFPLGGFNTIVYQGSIDLNG